MDRTNKAMIVISSLEFDSYVITKIKKKSLQSCYNGILVMAF